MNELGHMCARLSRYSNFSHMPGSTHTLRADERALHAYLWLAAVHEYLAGGLCLVHT